MENGAVNFDNLFKEAKPRKRYPSLEVYTKDMIIDKYLNDPNGTKILSTYINHVLSTSTIVDGPHVLAVFGMIIDVVNCLDDFFSDKTMKETYGKIKTNDILSILKTRNTSLENIASQEECTTLDILCQVVRLEKSLGVRLVENGYVSLKGKLISIQTEEYRTALGCVYLEDKETTKNNAGITVFNHLGIEYNFSAEKIEECCNINK